MDHSQPDNTDAGSMMLTICDRANVYFRNGQPLQVRRPFKHMTPHRSILHTLALTFVLLIGPKYGQGQFQIWASVGSGTYECLSLDFPGTVISVGHTYPIIIDWNFGQYVDTAYNDTEYNSVNTVELWCSSFFCDHHVKVTDGTGQIRTYVASVNVQPGFGFWTGSDEFTYHPYMPGDTIRGFFTITPASSMTMTASTPGIGAQPIGTTINCTNSTGENYCWGTWSSLLPVGSSVSAAGWNDCGDYGSSWISIGPPSVLPSWLVVDVEGSCANAPTGRITLAAAAEVPGPWPATTGRIRLRRVSDNTVINSIQYLPPGAVITTVPLLAGSYWVSIVDGPYVDVTDSVLVEVPSLGGICGTVTGRVFVDNNQDCTFLSNEPRVPEAILEILPGPYYLQTTTSTSGNPNYTQLLPTGSYTISMSHPQVEEHCTGGPIPFDITGSPGSLSLNLPALPTVPLDVAVQLSSGPARPGFELNYGMNVRNLTPASSGAITVTFVFDNTLTLLSATPEPSEVNGNTITWDQPQLTAWQARNYTMRFQVPPDVGLLGYELATTANVSTANSDGDLDNNTATDLLTITGAYDPNDKLARTSTGSDTWWVPGEDQWIDYTIRFQNTGTDSAFNVLITDTLPPELDPKSIVVGAASHAFHWLLRGSGILKFAFPGILLPDSNVNEAASHGFVTFRIKMREGMMTSPGDEVINTANIYFDFNPPIITDPCVLSVPMPEGVLLDVRVLLGGGYDPDTGLMHDSLRVQGLLPLQEPYTALGYDFPLDGGGETVPPDVLAVEGPSAIVDWVVLELRDIFDASIIYHARAALLRRDGQVVDTDGLSPVLITAPGAWFMVSVHHRNHLGVRTSYAQEMFDAGSGLVASFDFTVYPPAFIHGNEPVNEVGGVSVLWPGDVNSDGFVKYTGADNDRDAVLLGIGGSQPTNVVSGVYETTDVNLDGLIKYVGANNDRDVILQTIGGGTPTAVRVEQVP